MVWSPLFPSRAISGLLSDALFFVSPLILTLAKLTIFIYPISVTPCSFAIGVSLGQVSSRRTPDVVLGSPNSAARSFLTLEDSDTLQSEIGSASFISPNYE